MENFVLSGNARGARPTWAILTGFPTRHRCRQRFPDRSRQGGTVPPPAVVDE